MEEQLADIGRHLKERREQLGYSLQDAAQHTRIRRALLESIENNRFSDLPGQAYVTGFIRVYARYLGLDSDSLLAKLDDLPIGTGTSSVKYVPVAKHKPGRPRKPAARQGRSSLLLVILAILLIAGAVYILQGHFHDIPSAGPAPPQVAPQQEPVPTPAEPAASNTSADEGPRAADGPAADEHAGAAAHAEGAGGAEGEVAAGGAEGEVAAGGATNGEGAGGEVVAGGTALPAGEQPVVEVANATKSAEPKRFPPIAAEGSSLRMLAMSTSSLVIFVDGRTPHEYKLHNGLDLTWKIKKSVQVEMADPGAARFWLDGQELQLGDLSAFQLQTSRGD
jgi:cytoskeleton protein RodZ